MWVLKNPLWAVRIQEKNMLFGYPKKKIINYLYLQEVSIFFSKNNLDIILLLANATKIIKTTKNIFFNNIYLALAVFQSMMTELICVIFLSCFNFKFIKNL